jgi:hypothetical protein
VKRTDTQPPKHDPRDCNLCGTLRHPAQAKNGRALTRHLAANPFPRQAGGAR